MKINCLLLSLCFLFCAANAAAQSVINDDQYNVVVQRFQLSQNKFYKTPGQSPLKKEFLKDFTSLGFFDIDKSYRVAARYKPSADNEPFKMPTFYDNKEIRHIRRGELTFTIKDKEFTLGVYQREPAKRGKEQYGSSYFFVPFRDLTNGSDTFDGGRYIDLAKSLTESVTLDFNFAYTPYCAYNKGYICAVPPDENKMDVRVEAGEKIYTAGIDTGKKKKIKN